MRPRPAGLDQIAKSVEARLDAVLTEEEGRWSAIDGDLGRPFAALRRFVLAGGKRLRPAFCHWAFVGSGGDETDPVVLDAGCAFELLQAFALIHDDVMDGSFTRRGMDAVHVDFDAEHRGSGWRGESRRFGEGVAVLVGDLAFVLADRLLAGAPAEAWEIWNELRLEVNVGQYLDVVNSVRGLPSIEAARRINRYKTASYTIVRPLHLGAALAGADSVEVRTALAEFGLPLGEAFQLVDDLLGTFGDAERTGKPVGDDLREGKPTRLVAEGLARATGEDLSLLRERFGAPDLSEVEVERLQRVLESTGARAEVETAASALLDTALAALETAPLSGEARAALADLARFVVTRDH